MKFRSLPPSGKRPEDELGVRGLEVIKSMGLASFVLEVEPPAVDKRLCTQFISTFTVRTGTGMVGGRQVHLSHEAVAAVTGLPKGDYGSSVSGRILLSVPQLEHFIPFQAIRACHGYDLQSLKLRDKGDTRAIQTIGALSRFLTRKMLCRSKHKDYPPAGLLVGVAMGVLGTCGGQELMWASFMTTAMQKAIVLAKASCNFFNFGPWLTAVIRHSLSMHSAPAGALVAVVNVEDNSDTVDVEDDSDTVNGGDDDIGTNKGDSGTANGSDDDIGNTANGGDDDIGHVNRDEGDSGEDVELEKRAAELLKAIRNRRRRHSDQANRIAGLEAELKLLKKPRQ